jgi:hypothetical protein
MFWNYFKLRVECEMRTFLLCDQLFLGRDLRRCCRQSGSFETEWAFRQFLKGFIAAPSRSRYTQFKGSRPNQSQHKYLSGSRFVVGGRGGGELGTYLRVRCDPLLVLQPPVADLASYISGMRYAFFSSYPNRRCNLASKWVVG